MKHLIMELFDIGAIKFGNFILKSGVESPIYIDLRETISYPPLLQKIAEAMWQKAQGLSFDRLCGVPYTALPIVSYLSIEYGIPMVLRRKEAKAYGTKKIIEGVFDINQTCLVFEDLISSGASVLETILPLHEAGLHVRDVIVFLDREQGGKERLEKEGCTVHSVCTMTEMLTLLHAAGKISADQNEKVRAFLKETIHA